MSSRGGSALAASGTAGGLRRMAKGGGGRFVLPRRRRRREQPLLALQGCVLSEAKRVREGREGDGLAATLQKVGEGDSSGSGQNLPWVGGTEAGKPRCESGLIRQPGNGRESICR